MSNTAAIKIFVDDIYKRYITRPGADKLLDYLVSHSTFFQDPASTRFHLSEPGGLLEHSLNVYYRLRWITTAEHLRDPANYHLPSEETIAIVGLFHDLCKADTYIQQPKNFKNYDKVALKSVPQHQWKNDAQGSFFWDTRLEYTKKDPFPYGHGEKSVYLLNKFITLTDEEAMAIRYHMSSWNEWEKNDAGNVFETNKLAFFLHLADEFATFIDEVKS